MLVDLPLSALSVNRPVASVSVGRLSHAHIKPLLKYCRTELISRVVKP